MASDTSSESSRLVIDESVNESRVLRYTEGAKILSEFGLKIRPTAANQKIKAKKKKMDEAKQQEEQKNKGFAEMIFITPMTRKFIK